ncbi:MAG TPA: hypothetical protein VHO48_02520, partial [Anaerolineaceae bacterium]|nr:hypothetical protein [Anaerolineaceae bacterium]
MKAKILLIEGKHPDHPSFGAGLVKKGYDVDTAPKGNVALERLVEIDPDLVVIDAPSLRTSGKRICQALRKEVDTLPILLIVDGEHAESNHVSADVVLPLPFTIQKLVNRVKPLLPAE